MLAEVQLLSPLVPARSLSFLRYSKQHGEGVWAVVDVSVDIGRNVTNSHPLMSCRRLPSGCVIQDMPNGFSNVSAIIRYFRHLFSFVLQLHHRMLAGVSIFKNIFLDFFITFSMNGLVCYG